MLDGHKVLGIIGGMGPLATANVFEKIIDKTEASKDSDHIHVIIDSCPQIPDRTAAILNGTDDAMIAILKSARRLIDYKADLLIMTCCTAHYFMNDIQSKCKIEILDMIEETALELNKQDIKKVGLLATTGTVESKIFEKKLAKYGIKVVIPKKNAQIMIMHIIYEEVKRGKKADVSVLYNDLDKMVDYGVEKFILGCTELPIAFEKEEKYSFIDPTDVLVEKAIKKLGYKIKNVNI